MSVVPMKLLTMAGPLDRFDAVVRECVIEQNFHPENTIELRHDVPGLRPLSQENPWAPLLRRAEEVAALAVQRLSNREIAQQLFLSEGSVKQYINQIYSKLHIEGDARTKRAQLIQLANS